MASAVLQVKPPRLDDFDIAIYRLVEESASIAILSEFVIVNLAFEV
jgi:hypothetical protein